MTKYIVFKFGEMNIHAVELEYHTYGRSHLFKASPDKMIFAVLEL